MRQIITDLIVSIGRGNPRWGYERIQGALANVGYHISDTTVGNVLKQHGIESGLCGKRHANSQNAASCGVAAR